MRYFRHMNPTKAAAILALLVTVISSCYLGYQLYENTIFLRDANRILSGEDVPGPVFEYLIPGGIAVVSLITSLALFGAAKAKSSM